MKSLVYLFLIGLLSTSTFLAGRHSSITSIARREELVWRLAYMDGVFDLKPASRPKVCYYFKQWQEDYNNWQLDNFDTTGHITADTQEMKDYCDALNNFIHGTDPSGTPDGGSGTIETNSYTSEDYPNNLR